MFDVNNGAISQSDRKKRAKAEVEKAAGILGQCGLTPLWGNEVAAVVNKADAALEKRLKDLIENG
jgi:hypothetical protein